MHRKLFSTSTLIAAIVAIVLSVSPGQAQPVGAEPAAPASQLVESINRARAEAGLPLLTEDGMLDSLALERSADMVARHYFSHTTPDGADVFGMLRDRGVDFSWAGENIAWNMAGEGRTGLVAAEGFLASPPHRANILNASFSQVGVGVAAEGGRTYFTVVFLG